MLCLAVKLWIALWSTAASDADRSAVEDPALRDAVIAYEVASTRSVAALVDEVGDAERRLRERRRDDIDERVRRIRELRAQWTRFLEEGECVDAGALAAAVVRHRARVGLAWHHAESAFDGAAAAVLGTDRDRARAVLDEKERVLAETPTTSSTESGVAEFDVAIGEELVDLLRADVFPSRLRPGLGVRSELARGAADELAGIRSELRSAFDAARERVLAAYEEQSATLEGAPMPPEKILERLDELDVEREAFLVSPDGAEFPSWSKSAGSRHAKQRADALRRARAAAGVVAESVLADSLELAQAVLEVRDLWFPAPPTPPVRAARGVRRPRVPEPTLFGRELLVNGDCEAASQGRGVPGWEIVHGNWIPKLRTRSSDSYFSPNCERKRAELTQCVDVSSAAAWIDRREVRVTLAGDIKTYKKQRDQSQLRVEFLDDRGRVLDDGQTAREASWTWARRDVAVSVPRKTRKIRVSLVAIKRASGRQVNNDGYFDDVSLVLATD